MKLKFLVFTFIVLTAFFFTAWVSSSSQKNETSSFKQNTSKRGVFGCFSETANVKNKSTNYVQKNNLVKIKR